MAARRRRRTRRAGWLGAVLVATLGGGGCTAEGERPDVEVGSDPEAADARLADDRTGAGLPGDTEEHRRMREQMVAEQIERRRVRDADVLRAMRTVPRHMFVPDAYRERAYDDRPLPIGQEQTISQPYIVAYMTELARPRPGSVVLEVGTGSGYQAAVLAELGARVYTIELLEALGETARARLRELGYDGVHVRVGDGYYGWEEAAPFDAIVVTCGATEVPPRLLEQLAPGGRMVIPVGGTLERQELLLITKDEDGAVSERSMIPVRFVPFVHTEEPGEAGR